MLPREYRETKGGETEASKTEALVKPRLVKLE